MNNDGNVKKDSAGENSNSGNDSKNMEREPLPFHNPLKPDDDRQITREDIENEQKFKEALSERD